MSTPRNWYFGDSIYGFRLVMIVQWAIVAGVLWTGASLLDIESSMDKQTSFFVYFIGGLIGASTLHAIFGYKILALIDEGVRNDPNPKQSLKRGLLFGSVLALALIILLALGFLFFAVRA